MANVRSRVAFRIWVSGLLLASPQIFSGAWQSRTAFWVRLALWVRPGANRLLGTSSPAASFWSRNWSRVLFWCGLVVLSLEYFSNYLKVSSCTRYWQCGRRILNNLFVMCFYQFFKSFTYKLLPCFAMDGRHSRSDMDRWCHVCESLWRWYHSRYRDIVADAFTRPSTLAYGDCWSSQTKPIAHCQTSKYKTQEQSQRLRLSYYYVIACEKISIMEFRCLYLTLEIDKRKKKKKEEKKRKIIIRGKKNVVQTGFDPTPCG